MPTHYTPSLYTTLTCDHCGASYEGLIQHHELTYRCPSCPWQVGDTVSVRGAIMRIVAVHTAHTVDVVSTAYDGRESGHHYRVSGL